MLEQVGRYQLIEEIGQGGFAIVYRGNDTSLNRAVALKELRPALLADADWAKRFRREARTIAQLDHPHIVPIYDIYQTGTRLFIVMRLARGPGLDKMISTMGQIPWKEAIRQITAVATGLDYAHNHGVLHRDLKPANILIDEDRGPQLTDFGLAQLAGDHSRQMAGSIVGTPNYIAPEVWEGIPATAQSDIYALGCILFELLTGKQLFQGQTPLAVMKAHFMPLTLPGTWPEAVPPGVSRILNTALAEDPLKRFTTANKMIEALTGLATPAPPLKTLGLKKGPAKRTSATTPAPLLATKLYASIARSNLVRRPRLIRQLNKGLNQGCRLTLVVAPAGFGKTTLVNCWLTGGAPDLANNGDARLQPISQFAVDVHPEKVAWFSLDEGDNDPIRFFAYLTAALQNIGVTIELSPLAVPQLPPPEVLATTLINDLTGIPEKFALVLDDYHLIYASFIHEVVEFILAHQPPQMHLIITTREDPPLSLPRLRARGQVVEIRQEDLRFTAEEAASFLNKVMNLQLTAEAIDVLEARTEGWIAGLQLAALSLQGRSRMHVADFIETFSGSHRYVIDYLVEEVINQQPKNIRRFLRETAILNRFSAPLCNAVTDQPDSRLILNYLEQVNLFLIPLDDRRQWYRYHHLFAEFLQTELEPEQKQPLHQRAARWFEANGLLREAIDHSLAAQDIPDAGQLILQAADFSLRNGAFFTLDRWLNALPDDFVRSHPELSIYKGWVAFMLGGADVANSYARSAEAQITGNAPPATRGKLLSLKACLAITGDADGIELAKEAIPYLDETDTFFGGMALLVLGEAQNYMGDTTGAVETLQRALALGRKHGDYLMIVGALTNLAQQLNYQGKRAEAEVLCWNALEESTDDRGQIMPMADLSYITLAEMEIYTGKLEQTYEHLQKGINLAGKTGMIGINISGKLVMCHLQYAMGFPEDALKTSKEILQLTTKGNFEAYLTISKALVAEFQLKLGRLAPVREWAKTVQMPDAAPLSMSRELELLIYTRYLLDTNQPQPAKDLLAQIEVSARDSGRNLILIFVHILQAAALAGLGQKSESEAVITQAIQMAQPENYVLPFVQEGPMVLKLLPDVRHVAPEFVTTILNAGHKRYAIYDLPGQSKDVKAVVPPASPSSTLDTLVEPLTGREIEVLRVIASGQSNKEAAGTLYVTVGTVKKHLSNIFGKLGVNSRTQAIANARDLGLIP